MPIICRLPGRENLKALASAIGEPATQKDKKERLAEIIDNAQTDIASLCNEKGCNIPTHPTFPDIISGLNKVTHFFQSAQISNLSAQVGFSEPGKMILSWKNPTTDQNYSGVMIRYKAGSYQVSQTDGTLIYDSNGTLPASETVTVTGLSDGMSYYVRGLAYAISGASRIYTTSTTGAQCTAIPRQLKGQQVFTASSIFTVPYGVTSVDVFLVGGGGGGGGHLARRDGDGLIRSQYGNGGGGGHTATKTVPVTPGQQIAVTIGAGGQQLPDLELQGVYNSLEGKPGGTTSFGSFASANGGQGGPSIQHISFSRLSKAIKTGKGYPYSLELPESTGGTNPDYRQCAGSGGSGGGAGGYNGSLEGDDSTYYIEGPSGNGGSDGGNGAYLLDNTAFNTNNYRRQGGQGQHTTTRAFGESSNTLYASGGDGGVRNGANSTQNTGNGGQGCHDNNSYQKVTKVGWYSLGGWAGGSGVVIVRWGY